MTDDPTDVANTPTDVADSPGEVADPPTEVVDVPTGTEAQQVRFADRYVLLGQLGRGGMATVHRARDEVLHREVALKVLHPHLAADPAFRERFLSEGRAAAALSHANVVAIHDLAADADRAFLVLELVDGPTLRDVLRTRGRLTPNEALSLIGPAAAGLGAAHAKGLVHRDVKPANILITTTGVPKIGDFGLARAAAAAQQTFGSDVLVGSPHYLPPEAVDGARITASGDVYSLGVVLFEALTGRPPFQGDTPMATALQHTTGTVPPPSTVVAGIPDAIDEVVLRATSRDPHARFPDATAFGRALAAATAGGPAPVDLRDGQHHTMVMPRTGFDLPDDGDIADPDATRVVLRAPDPDQSATRGAMDRRRFLGWMGAVLVLLAAGGAAAWALIIAPMLDIPDVVGMQAAAALDAMDAAGFDAIVSDIAEHDLEVRAGSVLRQDQDGRARKGTAITLILSLGPADVIVPDVTGLEQGVAIATLREAGFDTEATFAYHPTIAEGNAIGTSPAADETALDGSRVIVHISRGREPVEVPVVVGMDVDEAIALLESAGLVGEVVETRFDEEAAENTVIDQTPAGLVDALRGDTVSLVVSRGPQPFALPDVRGQRKGEAERALEALGLVVEVQSTQTAFGFRRDRVAETDPPPGTMVRRGDTVVLFIYE